LSTAGLLDTSAFNRIADPDVDAALEDRLLRRALAICAPVAHEVSFSARNPAHLRQLRAVLAAFPQVRTHQATFDRALEVQAALCERGQHRAVSLADLLIAAAAEAADVPVVHYDADFDLIASVTGQPTEWVVPRGLIA
jgi:predicted nucleic acid-binding protein